MLERRADVGGSCQRNLTRGHGVRRSGRRSGNVGDDGDAVVGVNRDDHVATGSQSFERESTPVVGRRVAGDAAGRRWYARHLARTPFDGTGHRSAGVTDRCVQLVCKRERNLGDWLAIAVQDHAANAADRGGLRSLRGRNWRPLRLGIRHEQEEQQSGDGARTHALGHSDHLVGRRHQYSGPRVAVGPQRQKVGFPTRVRNRQPLRIAARNV